MTVRSASSVPPPVLFLAAALASVTAAYTWPRPDADPDPAGAPAPRLMTRAYLEIPTLALETTAQHASEVMHGRILSARPVFPPEGMPFTEYEMQVDSCLKGGDPGLALVQVGGARLGDRVFDVQGAPRLQVGDEIVLFACSDATGRVGPLGLWQGVYRVLERPGEDPLVVGTHAAEGETLPEFFGRIESILADAGREAEVMKNLSNELSLPLTAGLVAVLLAPALVAGGGEVYCNSIPGAEIHESWFSVPPTGVSWEVLMDFGGLRIGPNFPPVTCSQLLFPGQDDKYPGFQSLVSAAGHWSGATTPAGNPLSTFSFAPIPGIRPCGGFLCSTSLVMDGLNVLSLWEPAGTFSPPFGGPATVAIAAVLLDLSTGEIVEADISFNASSELSPGKPYWSFVESNALDGNSYATTTEDLSSSPWQQPAFGFVDLEGVATHELGHVLGLGHSLVDGAWNPSAGSSPTMFETGHTTSPFAATGTALISGCGSSTSFAMDASVTSVGGLLASGAKSLETDDLFALGSLYPSSAYSGELGSITGTVRGGASATVVKGQHVVAVNRNDPELRAGTLSMLGGVYTISGLPPGEYYVYAEDVDQFGGSPFFSPATVPNYVFQTTGILGGGCVAAFESYQMEYWDQNETYIEVAPLAADPVTVTAGSTASGVDLHLIGLPDGLDVCDKSACLPSPRGIRLAPGPGVDPVVELRVRSFTPGTPAFVAVSPVRATIPRASGELLLLGGSGAFPIILSATTDPAGEARFAFGVNNSLGHYHFVCQGAWLRSDGSLALTNSVSVFVDQP